MADITFRRINGRIVPIRKSGQSKSPGKGKAAGGIDIKEAAIGAAVAAAGVGVGLYAGKFAAKMVVSSALAENAARGLAREARTIFAGAAGRASRIAAKTAKDTAQLGLDLGDDAAKYVFKKGQSDYVKKISKIAIGNSVISETLFRNRKVVRTAGVALSGGLIGTGLKRIYESYAGKTTSVSSDVLASVTGTAGALAVSTGYYRFLSGGLGWKGYKTGLEAAARAFKLAK